MSGKFEKNGFSLIEAMVGIALIFIFFLGIYNAFVFGLKVIGQSKAKVSAMALANKKIEEIRNLPYNDIGTIGGIPPGVLNETENVELNAVNFEVKTTVLYYDDSADGLAPDDTLPTDYKKAEVKVSWQGFFGGEVKLSAYIAPKGVESNAGGGTIKISVINANGEGVSQADIHIKNDNVYPSIDANYQTDDYGNLIIAGAPTSTEGYFIEASKNGYNSDKTYSRNEVANPAKPYLSVFEGKVSEIYFSIDKTANFSIETRAIELFTDNFENSSKVAKQSNVSIGDGQVSLSNNGGSYSQNGYLISKTISPANLLNWAWLSWQDDVFDFTDIRYQLLYATTSDFSLIPDSDLPGNSTGFNNSPVDISQLDIQKYNRIRIKGNLSSQSSSLTPYLYSWEIAYNTQLIGGTNFHIQGEKIIGTNNNGDKIYKYSKDLQTESSGYLNLYGLEWDSYNFSENTSTTMTLVKTNPSPQPIDLLPDETKKASLYFKAENSLLVEVNDASTTEPIFGANVHLSNSNYDESKPTDKNGKSLFIPLDNDSYKLEVGSDGYEMASTSVSVFGDSVKKINLTKND